MAEHGAAVLLCQTLPRSQDAHLCKGWRLTIY